MGERSEPSMDEILSSIKKIIAEDDGGTRSASKRTSRAAKSEIDEDEAIVQSEAADDSGADSSSDLDNDPGREDLLLDDSKTQSLRHSFSALQTLSEPGAAPQIVRAGETSLESLAREMMRPMLKEWLEANLPGIVESMVDREITRITKKG